MLNYCYLMGSVRIDGVIVWGEQKACDTCGIDCDTSIASLCLRGDGGEGGTLISLDGEREGERETEGKRVGVCICMCLR